MTKRAWLIVALVAVLALGAGVGIGAAAWAGADHDDDGVASAHDGSMMGATMGGSAMTERAFLEEMVPHHETAVQMAQMAIAKGNSDEVRGLADEILATQQEEIARMRAIHQDAFGEELGATGPHASVETSELEAATGQEFDRAFLRMMIPHHASAITMSESVTMGEPRQEVETLANEIIAAQSKDIGEMQEWRERFFPPLG